MHFTGRTWRPNYEADSCIIQLTAGCTYQKCHFCNLSISLAITVPGAPGCPNAAPECSGTHL